MPDITKCTNDECHLKSICYRFTCTPSEHQQSYARFEPQLIDKKNYIVECDKYIEQD